MLPKDGVYMQNLAFKCQIFDTKKVTFKMPLLALNLNEMNKKTPLILNVY